MRMARVTVMFVLMVVLVVHLFQPYLPIAAVNSAEPNPNGPANEIALL
jgi:hypothetical protein